MNNFNPNAHRNEQMKKKDDQFNESMAQQKGH